MTPASRLAGRWVDVTTLIFVHGHIDFGVACVSCQTPCRNSTVSDFQCMTIPWWQTQVRCHCGLAWQCRGCVASRHTGETQHVAHMTTLRLQMEGPHMVYQPFYMHHAIYKRRTHSKQRLVEVASRTPCTVRRPPPICCDSVRRPSSNCRPPVLREPSACLLSSVRSSAVGPSSGRHPSAVRLSAVRCPFIDFSRAVRPSSV